MDKDRTFKKLYWKFRNNIDDYLSRGNDQYDVLQVLFILLSVKNKVKLNFTDDNSPFFDTNASEAVAVVHYAASILPDQVFYPLQGLYEQLVSLSDEEFQYVYSGLFYDYILRDKSMSDCPPHPLLYTIASYLRKNGCKSVLQYSAGLPLLTFDLPTEVRYTAIDDRMHMFLLGALITDDRNIENHTVNTYVDSDIEFEAFVQLSLNDNRIETRLASLAENRYGCKYAFIMVGSKGKQSYEDLCKSGYIESVITIPQALYMDCVTGTPFNYNMDFPISLIVLNYENKKDSITFYGADEVFPANAELFKGLLNWKLDLFEYIPKEKVANVTLEELAETNYSMNAYYYLQDAVCEPGQELVRLSDLAYAWETFEDLPETDPLAVEFKAQGELVVTSVVRCSEATSYVLIPDTDIIEPEYLAYVLRNDPSFSEYLGNLHNDGIFMPGGIMHRMVPIYTDKKKQYEILVQLNGGLSTQRNYNIVYADSSSEVLEDIANSLDNHNISILAHLRTVEELSSYLESNAADSESSYTNIDAVIFNAEIPYSDQEKDGEYEGFREIIMLKKEYEMPFYVFSDVTPQEMPVPKRHLSYFTENGRFYSSDKASLSCMAENLLHELNYLNSDDSVIRNKYPDFYVAAEWLDSKRPGLNVVARVSEIIKQDLNCSQGEMENTVNDIRIMAEALIRWMQELNIAPPAHLMTPGEVARLLRDRYYKEYTFTEKDFMYKPLASMLVALFDVGNYGSHKFFDTDLYRRTATMILMSFVQWVYEKKDFFNKKHEGFYICVSSAEKSEFVDVVQCDTSKPVPYYYCRNVHLETSKFKKLKAGDKIRVTDYTAERAPRSDIGVIYYSRSQQWSKIEDER